jgi:hypothetical protein
MPLKFEEWLVEQQDRNDLIGDLAHLLRLQNSDGKPSTRKLNEHKNWADIVIGMAEPEYIAAFNEAWQEYLTAKQTASDSLD